MMIIWLVGLVLSCVAFGITFVVSHPRRAATLARWNALLAEDALAAAQRGAIGTLEGLASDGRGRFGPLIAPFSGRPCLAFHVEVIVREEDHNVITWRQAFEDAHGQLLVTGPGHDVRGRADLQGASVLFPSEVTKGAVPGTTVFASSRSMFGASALPPHLLGFLQSAGLPAATQDSLFSSGRELVFNERIIVPGQPVVVAGPCSIDPEGFGSLLQASGPGEVFFTTDPGATTASLRTRARKAPMKAALGDAAWAGVLGVVCTMIAYAFSLST